MSEINTEPQMTYQYEDIDIDINSSPSELASMFADFALQCENNKWTDPKIGTSVNHDSEGCIESVNLTVSYSRLETPEETQRRIKQELKAQHAKKHNELIAKANKLARIARLEKELQELKDQDNLEKAVTK